ncbi:hypothetical protein [Nocardia asteroides]|uniref:hypothetical protein n=1 Tax=Nocardia asteroides TaxID=1824 RepID=UPI0033EC90D0
MNTTITGRRAAPLPLCVRSGQVMPITATDLDQSVGTLDEQPVDAVVQSTKDIRQVWQRGDAGEWWGVGSGVSLTSVDLAARGPWRRIA